MAVQLVFLSFEKCPLFFAGSKILLVSVDVCIRGREYVLVYIHVCRSVYVHSYAT